MTDSDFAPCQSQRPRLAGTGMTGFETETVESCRSLGMDPAHLFLPRLACCDPARMCQRRGAPGNGLRAIGGSDGQDPPGLRGRLVPRSHGRPLRFETVWGPDRDG